MEYKSILAAFGALKIYQLTSCYEELNFIFLMDPYFVHLIAIHKVMTFFGNKKTKILKFLLFTKLSLQQATFDRKIQSVEQCWFFVYDMLN